LIGEISIQTKKRECFLDITNMVKDFVERSGVKEGLGVVFVPHTTAGVTINECADPDVVSDILNHLEKMVPRDDGFRHVEGNSDAHVKSSMVGSSVTVFVQDGRLVLGTWQAIFFAEFDGPRHRQVKIQVTPALK